jgi:hypothetical protein
MKFGGNSMQRCKLVLSLLLVVAIAALLVRSSSGGTQGPSQLEAIAKFPFKSFEGIRQKATHRPVLAVSRAKVNVAFVSFSFLLRLDFKQNLRLWPVLSNDLERSPPFIAVL